MTDNPWDQPTLELLDSTREVRIETTRPDGTVRRTIVWVVVDDGEVFVRSWKGDRGHWYQAAIDAPDDVAMTAGKERMPIRVVHATDEQSIDRCSRALETKYKGDPSTPSMVRPYNLGTTLRLERR